VHDAAYVLAFPLAGSVAFSQDGRTGFAKTRRVRPAQRTPLLRTLVDKNTRLLMIAFPQRNCADGSSASKTMSAVASNERADARLLAGHDQKRRELFIILRRPIPRRLRPNSSASLP